MKILTKMALTLATLSLCGTALADITVQMNMADDKGLGKSVGQVIISETPYGVVLTPALTGLPQGLHGFHVHENPSCAPMDKDGKMKKEGASKNGDCCKDGKKDEAAKDCCKDAKKVEKTN